MNQDQDKKKKNNKKKTLEFTSISPQKVYSRHLSSLTLRGKGFSKGTINSMDLQGLTLVDSQLVNAKKMVLTVRAKAATEFTWASLSLKDPSLEKPLEIRLTMAPDPLPGFSYIPEGKFTFGQKGTASERELSKKAFASAIYEVSCRDYMDFLNFIAEQGDHSFCHPDEPKDKSHTPDFFDDALRHHPSKPVTGIDWYDAWAYANWRGFRLPSQEEWEKAVRGDKGLSYPWGENPNTKLANTSDTSKTTGYISTFGVGAGQYGLLNGVGNVWEFTDSPGLDNNSVIIKGGSFKTPIIQAKVTSKSEITKLTRRDDIGFRCAADPSAEVMQELHAAWLAEEAEKEAKEKELAQAKAQREANQKSTAEAKKKDQPKQQTNAKIESDGKAAEPEKKKDEKELTPKEKRILERKKKRAAARKAGTTKKKDKKSKLTF